MIDPIAGWRAEHANFARLLELFNHQVERFHTGELPDYELMLDIVTYLRHFPERMHHPREDVAFQRLVRHDRSTEPLVNRFAQEHRVIAQLGQQVHSPRG